MPRRRGNVQNPRLWTTSSVRTQMPFGRRIHLASCFEDFVFIVRCCFVVVVVVVVHTQRERKNRQHIREIQNACTNTHTDRQRVMKRVNKKARFMLPSKNNKSARTFQYLVCATKATSCNFERNSMAEVSEDNGVLFSSSCSSSSSPNDARGGFR